MKKKLKNLHSFAPLCHECFRKVVEGKEKGVKSLSLTPCILMNNKGQKIIRGSFPQTRTLTGLSYTPLLFYGCKSNYSLLMLQNFHDKNPTTPIFFLSPLVDLSGHRQFQQAM